MDNVKSTPKDLSPVSETLSNGTILYFREFTHGENRRFHELWDATVKPLMDTKIYMPSDQPNERWLEHKAMYDKAKAEIKRLQKKYGTSKFTESDRKHLENYTRDAEEFAQKMVEADAKTKEEDDAFNKARIQLNRDVRQAIYNCYVAFIYWQLAPDISHEEFLSGLLPDDFLKIDRYIHEGNFAWEEAFSSEPTPTPKQSGQTEELKPN